MSGLHDFLTAFRQVSPFEAVAAALGIASVYCSTRQNILAWPTSLLNNAMYGVFFLQQKLAKDPGVADAKVKPREVQRVGVLGAGIMGAGIAGAHVRRGVPALLLDSVPAALEKGVGNIMKVMQARIEIGRMTPDEVLGAMSKLATTMDLKQMADRDVVIEAVVENEAVKKDLYRQLQSILPDQAILASNTSTISITKSTIRGMTCTAVSSCFRDAPPA